MFCGLGLIGFSFSSKHLSFILSEALIKQCLSVIYMYMRAVMFAGKIVHVQHVLPLLIRLCVHN